MGLSRRFASIGPQKNRKIVEISLQGESSLPAEVDFPHFCGASLERTKEYRSNQPLD
jgi:hypothetical protein